MKTKRVDCIGMVGKLPTPKGLMMFWDTGRSLTPVQLAEMLALQHSVFSTSGQSQKKAMEKVGEVLADIAHKVDVYPIGQAALADDGRILVTEPWFESRE